MMRLAVCLVLFVVSIPVAAQTDATAAAELPPVECVRMVRAARIALDRGDKDEGARLLRLAAEQFPDEVVPLLELWNFHNIFGLPEGEAARLRGLLTRLLADPNRSLPPGVLRYLVQNKDAGEEELQMILDAATGRLTDDDVEMLEAVAVLQLRLDRKEAARETYGKLLEVDPSEYVRWSCIQLDLELEDWASAAANMKVLIDSEAEGAFAPRLLYVDVLGKLGRYDELVAQLELIRAGNVVMRDMINELLVNAAWNMRDAGRDDKAEELFRRVVASDPQHREARLAVLHLYGTDEERRAHEAALETKWNEESDADALLEEGGNLLAAGNAEAAFGLLERAAPELPTSEIAWYNLGLAALQLERWDVAERAFGKAAEINPGRAESFFSRGTALQKLDRCKEAIPVLKQTLVVDATMKQARYYLYACYAKLGDDDNAREQLRLYQGN